MSVAYILTYQAASPNRLLSVSVVQQGAGANPWSNVMLQAAALAAGVEIPPHDRSPQDADRF